jgi:methylmalonyl-CoA/ethylmalonyl-CoA epimerase
MIKRIDHIGIAVNNIDKALEVYADALGLQLTETDKEEGQKSIVAFLPAGESEVELVEPIGEDGPVARFLKKRGEGIHHICFEVDDIYATLGQLKAHGVQLIDEQPYIGTGGKKIAFIHPKGSHGVLIELYQKVPEEARPQLIDLESLRRMWDIQTEAAREGAREFLRVLQQGDGESPSGRTG